MSKTISAFTLNHLALSVKDLNTSIGFYKELFDLQEITNRTEIEGIRWLSLGEGKELHFKFPVVPKHCAKPSQLYKVCNHFHLQLKQFKND